MQAGRAVARRPLREGGAAEAADRRVEASGTNLQGGQDVDQARAAGLVEVQGDVRTGGRRDLPDAPRGRHAGCGGKGQVVGARVRMSAARARENRSVSSEATRDSSPSPVGSRATSCAGFVEAGLPEYALKPTLLDQA